MSAFSAAADYFPIFRKSAPKFVTESGARVYGMVAEYPTAEAAYHACEHVRDAGYKKWDLNTPFPIHGIEEAMGARKSILPYIVFSVGLGGVFAGWLLQMFMTDWDYKIVVQGKPYDAWEAFVPIMFELGILHAAFAALIGMLALNGLPRFNHPLFNSERFLGTSDDRFIIGIEADDNGQIDVQINGNPIRSMILDTGASAVSLPHLFAKDLGIEVSDTDPTVQLQMADAAATRASVRRIGRAVVFWLLFIRLRPR